MTGNAKCSICTERLWSFVRSAMQKSRAVISKNDVTDGEPYTWRRVSTVRGQVNENLPLQSGKALFAEPTDYRFESK